MPSAVWIHVHLRRGATRPPAASASSHVPTRKGSSEPVEPHVDRQRRVELDRVERNEPEHGEEDGQHPRQEPRRARPVVVVRLGPVAGEPLAQRLQAGRRACGAASAARRRRTRRRRATSPARPTAAERTKATMKVRPPITRAEPPFTTPGARLAEGRSTISPDSGTPCSSRDRAQVVAQPAAASSARRCASLRRRRLRVDVEDRRRRAGLHLEPVGRLDHSISLARCSLPGSVSAIGTNAVIRPTPPNSSGGTPARRAIRSVTGGEIMTLPISSACRTSVSMSCGSTLRLTIDVRGRVDHHVRDTAVATCRLLVLSFGGNSADRADVDAGGDETDQRRRGRRRRIAPLAVLEHWPAKDL